MDQDDKCLTYGHPSTKEVLVNVRKKDGTESRRRKRIKVCTRCHGRV